MRKMFIGSVNSKNALYITGLQIRHAGESAIYTLDGKFFFLDGRTDILDFMGNIFGYETLAEAKAEAMMHHRNQAKAAFSQSLSIVDQEMAQQIRDQINAIEWEENYRLMI